MNSKPSAICNQRSAKLLVLVSALLLVAAFPMAVRAADAQQALVWLEGQQRADDSWCMASQQPEANSQQQACAAYTSEVLQAGWRLEAGGWSGASAAKAIGYIENIVPHDTGTLARKLLIGKMAGYVRAEEVEKLKSLVTEEGGYAAWESYMSPDMYRTIPALQFLAGYDLTLAARAALYLASLQNLDGSFSPAKDVATTAEFIMVLSLQVSAVSQSDPNVQAAVVRGLDFIVSKANPDGTIGTEPDPICDTLLGVLAVQTIAGDVNGIVPRGVAYLASQLDGDSSIRQDAYFTALYVRIAKASIKVAGRNQFDARDTANRRVKGASDSIVRKPDLGPKNDARRLPTGKRPFVSAPPGSRIAVSNGLPMNISEITGVEDGLCTVQDVTPRLGDDASVSGAVVLLDGIPFGLGTPVTAEGEHVLSVQGVPETVRFTIDRTPPTVEIQGVEDGSQVERRVIPSIAVHDPNLSGMNATLNGVPYETGMPITEEGQYKLVVTAWDCAGNLEEKAVSFFAGKAR
jgi:hypothetical protein